MAILRLRSGAYSSTYTTDTSTLVMPSGYGSGIGTRHVIIGCHGHGGYSYQYAPAFGYFPGYHTQYLADTAGIVTMGVDHSAINAWGDPTAMRALDDAYNWLVNTFKMPTLKIGLMGWSMGGLTALNWMIRNPTKVAGAWLWNPATDLRFWRDASGAYTPTYANPNAAPQGVYTAEINTVYGSSTTATAAVTVPAVGSAGVTVTVGSGKEFADGLTIGSAALPQATIAGVLCTYTSKDDTHLYGVVSTTASTVSVINGSTVVGAWTTQYPAYSPFERAAGFSVANGMNFPVKIVQATDDATVPPAQNSDVTNGFVARAANPNITLRTPAVTGGHTNPFAAIPVAEVNAFYSGLSW